MLELSADNGQQGLGTEVPASKKNCPRTIFTEWRQMIIRQRFHG
jgi:hypothetical protein